MTHQISSPSFFSLSLLYTNRYIGKSHQQEEFTSRCHPIRHVRPTSSRRRQDTSPSPCNLRPPLPSLTLWRGPSVVSRSGVKPSGRTPKLTAIHLSLRINRITFKLWHQSVSWDKRLLPTSDTSSSREVSVEKSPIDVFGLRRGHPTFWNSSLDKRQLPTTRTLFVMTSSLPPTTGLRKEVSDILISFLDRDLCVIGLDFFFHSFCLSLV